MFDLGSLKYGIEIDSKAAQAELKAFDKSLKSFGDKATKVGKSLTKNLTLPILAVGGASLKLAADFEVASRKFAGAFAGSEKAAAASLENLNKNFGISISEGTKLLGFTGDLLKGFGATSDQALELANSTNEVAAALAAYNGTSVVQASEAITKALLGERESLKLLGVSIQESAVQSELLARGQQNLTGQALLLAKAQITLKLAADQSADAIGKFAENTDTLAFQSKTLFADLKDVGVSIGTVLIPVVKEVVGIIKEWVGRFQELDETQIQNILKIAALVAALGPAITAVGTMIKVVQGLSAAMAFLAANPIVLAIAGVAALGVGIGVLVAKNRQKQLEELTDKFGDLAVATGVASDEVDRFVEGAALIENALNQGDYGRSFMEAADAAADLDYQVTQLAINTGYTREQIIGIGLASDNVSDSLRESLVLMQEQETATNLLLAAELDRAYAATGQEQAQLRIKKAQEEQVKLAEESRAKEEQITAELEAQNAAREASIKARIDARITAEQKYTKTLDEAKAAFDFGIIDSQELLQQQIDATKQQIQDLISADYRGGDVWEGTLGLETIRRMQEQLPLLEAELDKVIETSAEKAKADADAEQATLDGIEAEKDAIKTREELNQKYIDLLLGQSDQKEVLLAKERDAAIKLAEETGANVYAVELYYNGLEEQLREERAAEEKAAADEAVATEKDKWDRIAQITQLSFSTLGGMLSEASDLYGQYVNQQIAWTQYEKNERLGALDEWYQAELAAAGIVQETKLDSLQEQLADAIASGDAEAQAKLTQAIEKEKIDQEYAKAKENIEKDQAKKEYEIKLKSFKTQKALDIAQTIMSTGLAAMRAYASLAVIPIVGPILGGIAAAAAIVFGGIQIGLIKSQPPPPKPFADGGIVNNPGPGINAIVGEAGPEAILPLNDKTLGALGQAITESQQGDVTNSNSSSGLNSLTVIIEGLGSANIPITQSALNNGQIRIPASTIVQGI
jgi:hypothetical protein